MLAAIFTAAFFLLLTVKLVAIAIACGLVAVVMMFGWMWTSDPAPTEPVDIGGGLRLPTYQSGPSSHSWWAMVVLMLVAGSLFLSFVFSYLYLWVVSPQLWPQADGHALPAFGWAVISGLLLAASSAGILACSRAWSNVTTRGVAALTIGSVAALGGALAIDLWSHWQSGLRPDASAYGAMVYLGIFLQLQLVIALVAMAAFITVRRIAGRIGAANRNSFESLALLWHYAVGQGLTGLLLVHGFPRVIG